MLKVTDGWAEANGQECVEYLGAMLAHFDDFMVSEDKRIHVDNKAWLGLVEQSHFVRIFLNRAEEQNATP